MSENVSRRRALSVLGAAIRPRLAPTEYEAEAETARIERRQHRRGTAASGAPGHPQQRQRRPLMEQGLVNQLSEYQRHNIQCFV